MEKGPEPRTAGTSRAGGVEQRTVPESLPDVGLMRPVTEALSLHRLLHQLRPARAAPCGPSPLPTQVQGLLQREMDREGWRREGGLCPEAQKHPRPGYPSDYSPGRDARGTCQSHSWSRTWWGAGASREKGGEPWGGQGRWARGAPGRPGARVPRPPTGPVLHHPGTPTRGPLHEDPQCRGRGGEGGPTLPTGPRAPPPVSQHPGRQLASSMPPC